MNTDIRVDITFKGHRKRRRLQALLGPGATDYLIDLWITVAMERPQGVLRGWDSTDIALAAGFPGDPEQLVSALYEAKLLDKDADGNCCLHDWKIHQPWASNAPVRSEAARKAVTARWTKQKQQPDDTDSIRSVSKRNTDGIHSVSKRNTDSIRNHTPSPSPSPSPLVLDTSYLVRATKEKEVKEEKDTLVASTDASKYLFEKTGRKRWANPVQKQAFEKVEQEVGPLRVIEAVDWALLSGINNIKSILTAAQKGGPSGKKQRVPERYPTPEELTGRLR
jgi:hypothetical protein